MKKKGNTFNWSKNDDFSKCNRKKEKEKGKSKNFLGHRKVYLFIGNTDMQTFL